MIQNIGSTCTYKNKCNHPETIKYIAVSYLYIMADTTTHTTIMTATAQTPLINLLRASIIYIKTI